MTMPSAEPRRILVADDDAAVRSALERVLRFNGYEVELAEDGLETLEAIDRARPDAVVLDWMMPHLDGLGACRMLRGRGDDLPVLLLTARDGLGDRIAGLDAGADDYIAKPFELEELMARLRALLRRSHGFGPAPSAEAPEEILRFADLVMNVDTREVRRAGRVLRLTRTEFNLLELLMRRPRRVLERAWIHEEVWGFDFGRASNSLHVYIGYLRRKTEEHGGGRLIHTVRGVGYALREEPS
ncbi:response regulator transcription factor [Actinomadura fibrosa]|uniref:Response regulator transcription factor n=1 Tax=Actinomadura fibrosa TaxID=111802 RepID=A0ABW2XM63_9ACTN|nr:response regulator transcription factor [Actinomadura fibrosa]